MDRIDMQGSKGVSSSLKARVTTPVAQAPTIRPVETGSGRIDDLAVTSVASAGAEPPVDHERVAQIRKAIEQGRYPIVPTKIADAMIAAGYLLRTP